MFNGTCFSKFFKAYFNSLLLDASISADGLLFLSKSMTTEHKTTKTGKTENKVVEIESKIVNTPIFLTIIISWVIRDCKFLAKLLLPIPFNNCDYFVDIA